MFSQNLPRGVLDPYLPPRVDLWLLKSSALCFVPLSFRCLKRNGLNEIIILNIFNFLCFVFAHPLLRRRARSHVKRRRRRDQEKNLNCQNRQKKSKTKFNQFFAKSLEKWLNIKFSNKQEKDAFKSTKMELILRFCIWIWIYKSSGRVRNFKKFSFQ